MKVWVMTGSYDGELFSSVHLTQKGCALACIADVLDFLGIEDEETASQACDQYAEGDSVPDAPEWDHEKMKEMTSKQLWTVFQDWCEISCWRMSERMYNIDASSVEIQG